MDEVELDCEGTCIVIAPRQFLWPPSEYHVQLSGPDIGDVHTIVSRDALEAFARAILGMVEG
jgi:hypothetical protein